MTRRVLVLMGVLAVWPGVAAPAHAELVFFFTGRTLSVKSHHLDGDTLVLTLRGGGEIVCDPSVVSEITPDEVPYPEPETAPTVVSAPQPPLPATVRYADVIDRVSAQQGVDAKLVRAVIQVESSFNERARSRKGAMGLMQLMPDTARQYAVTDPFDPVANIEGGIKYLKSLLNRFPRPLALAAYNAGEAAVQRFGGVPPYPETRSYVTKILGLIAR